MSPVHAIAYAPPSSGSVEVWEADQAFAEWSLGIGACDFDPGTWWGDCNIKLKSQLLVADILRIRPNLRFFFGLIPRLFFICSFYQINVKHKYMGELCRLPTAEEHLSGPVRPINPLPLSIIGPNPSPSSSLPFMLGFYSHHPHPYARAGCNRPSGSSSADPYLSSPSIRDGLRAFH